MYLLKIILIYILFFSITCSAQVMEFLSSDTLDETMYDGLYFNDSHYFLYSKGIYNSANNMFLLEMKGFNSYLLKFNHDFSVIDSVRFDTIGNYLIQGRQIAIYKDTIYVLGRAMNPENPMTDSQVFIAELLPDLTMIDAKLISTGTEPVMFRFFTFNQKGNLIISPIRNYDNSGDGYFCFLECERDGTVIYSEVDTTFTTEACLPLQLPVSKKYVFNDRFYTRIYDSTFNLEAHFFPIYIPQFFRFQYGADNYMDDTYFIGGFSTEKELIDQPEEISFYRVDTLHNRLDSGVIHFPDTSDFFRGLDFREPNTLVFGGNHNFKFLGYPGEFQPNLQYLAIKSVNTDTREENWTIKYGGDAGYWMKGLYVTPQLECIVYATRYDWMNTDELERDILILKIDSNGVLVNEKEIKLQSVAQLFPNPGTSHIKVWTDAGYPNCTFELYDLNGKQCIRKQINGIWGEVYTSFLSPGIYIYKIYNKKGLSESGKWIKN